MIDWSNLSFGYMPTDYNVRCNYHNGKWGEIEVHSEETIPMSMAATCLHYGPTARSASSAPSRTPPACSPPAAAS